MEPLEERTLLSAVPPLDNGQLEMAAFDGELMPGADSPESGTRVRLFDNFNGTWCDAEKDATSTEDDLLCWAGTASNMLEWSGWGFAGGMMKTDQMFDYYEDHWTDQGGLPMYAIEWWLNGTNGSDGMAGWSQVDVAGGNFYPAFDYSAYVEFDSNPANVMTHVDDWTADGYGIGLSLRGGGLAHEVTCWGYNYDAGDPDYYVGVWISDSDDDKGVANGHTAPNDLHYYAIDWDSTDSHWNFDSYFAGSHLGYVTGMPRYSEGIITLNGDQGSPNQNDNINVTLDATGMYLEVRFNGTLAYDGPLSTVQELNILGWGGDDTLTVDFTNGDPVPAGGLMFDGGTGGGDGLTVVGTGGSIGSYLPGTTAGDGVVNVDGSEITFTGLDPVVVGGFNEFTFITPNSNDVLTVDSPGAGQNRISGTSGGVAFESLTFSNVTNFKIDTAANDAPLANPNDTVTFTADLVAAGLGSFTVETGAGDDVVNAASVTSLGITALGGAGDDTLTGGAGGDRLEGGEGNDDLTGNAGFNDLLGGDGIDFIFSTSSDVFEGGDGHDVLNFDDGAGNYTVDPFFGSLWLTGPGGANAIGGGIEEVQVGLNAGAGGDFTVGDLSALGVDLVVIGGSRPSLGLGVTAALGGTLDIAGSLSDDNIDVAESSLGSAFVGVGLAWGEVAFFGWPTGTLDIDGREGNDNIKVDPTAPLGGTAIILNGGTGNDYLSADAILNGGDGNDILVGGAGSDTMNGGAGDDTFIGNGGTDTVTGGTGFDTILVPGTDADDTISVVEAAGAHTVTINGAATTYAAGSSFERILVQGGVGDDSVTASGAVVGLRVEGGADNDTVDASAATTAATLLGEDGNDVLTAAQGGGLLDGGHDDDVLIVNGGLTSGLLVIGGDPSASDVLNLVGQAQTVETVTIMPDATNSTEQDVTGLGALIDVSGVELITFDGVDDADTLTVVNGPGDDDVRVELADVLAEKDRVLSNALPEIQFRAIDTFRLDQGLGLDTATFALVALRGAANYEVSSTRGDSVIVEGNDGAFLAGDRLVVTKPALGDFAVTDTMDQLKTLTSLWGSPRLELRTLGGDDLVTVDDSGGLIAEPITYDGGANSDTLLVTGTFEVQQVEYRPGPDVLEGRLTYDLNYLDPAKDMTIDFINLEPVIDLVPKTVALTVYGTNADNAINYTAGPNSGSPLVGGMTTGLVSVDAYETIEFANFTGEAPDDGFLEIIAEAGDDVVSLNNPVLPTGLERIWVEGNDPTASDTVIVNGSTGPDTIDYRPLGIDSAVITGVQGVVQVDVQTAEQVVIDGQGGSDALTIETPAGQEQIDFQPGATADAASLTFRGYGANTLLPVRYENIGTGGSLTLDDAGAVRNDDLTVNGRDLANAREEFFVGVGGLAADQVLIRDGTSGTFQVSVIITAAGVDELRLNGLAGDDLFQVAGGHAFTGGILIDGGEPADSDILEFQGQGATVTVDLEDVFALSPVVSVTEDLLNPVYTTGIELIDLNAGDATPNILGTGDDDDVTVTVFDDESGKIERGYAVQRAGQVDSDILDPLILYSNTDGNAVNFDLGGGEDTLVVVGSTYGTSPPSPDAAQVFDIDIPNRRVDIDNEDDATLDGSVTWAATPGAIESLEAWGLEGADTFDVIAGSIPLFIDGGDPIGVTAGDKFGILGGGGGVAFEPGPENDEGGIRVGTNARISFDHIEEGEVVGAPCALVIGTNGDDDITIIARNELANPPEFLGTDGVQDFTSSVNGGIEILWTDVPELYIDALAGDDDIVLRTRAPNAADWDMEVYIVGGPPASPTVDQGDVVEIETPYATDDVVYTPTGPETADVLLDENGNGVYDGTDTLIQIVSEFVIDCDGDEENEYRSSPGGVEAVVYDGVAPFDDLTINGTAVDDTVVFNPSIGLGSGTLRSGLSPDFDFSIVDDLEVSGGGGFDVVNFEGSAGPDSVFSTPNLVMMSGASFFGTVTLGTGLDRLNVLTFEGNDHVDLDLGVAGLEKVVDAGAGDDTVDLSNVLPDPADPLIIGGIGDDNLIGSPNADLIFGGAGNDTINALGGDDTIYGDEGNDLITGGADSDDLFGGDGSDVFIWIQGDGSDLIEGEVGQDELWFNGAGAAQHATEDITLRSNSAVAGPQLGDRVELLRLQDSVLLDMAGVETINMALSDGDENVHIEDLYNTDAQVVNIGFGDFLGFETQTLVVEGRAVADDVEVTVDASQYLTIEGLRYDIHAFDTDRFNDTLTINGNEGDDSIKAEDGVESLIAIVLNGNAGDDFLSADATLNGGPGDDFLEGGSGADTLNGGPGEDTMIGGGGADLFDGGADFDTILIQGTSGNDVIDVVEDFAFNPNVRLRHEVNGVAESDEVVVSVGGDVTVERALVQAGDGADLIRVRVADQFFNDPGTNFGLSMVMAVEGGSQIAAGDRLVIVDDGTDDLVLYRKGVSDDEGTVTVGPANAEPFENVFTEIEYVQFVDENGAAINPEPGDLSRLVVFKHDPFEYNNDRFVATYLGVNQTVNVDPKIDPGALVNPFGDEQTIPGDEDWYRVEAEVTGTLDFQVFFEEVGTLDSGRPGLPSNGNLDIEVYDIDGTLIAGAGPAWGGNDGGGLNPELNVDGDVFEEDERVRIPAVQGQTYLLRVVGVETAINNYNLSVINAAAPVPYDIEVNDIIVYDTVRLFTVPTATVFRGNNAPLSSANDFYNGKYVHFTSGALAGQRAEITDYNGALRQFTVAAGSFTGAPAQLDAFFIETHDTGHSQFDDVTRDNTPIIVLRLDDAIFLHDLPGNPADDTPPDEVIPIPFNTDQTATTTTAGFRVAIFDEGVPQQPGQLPQVPVGYARQIAEGVYEFDFETDAIAAPFVLTDGSHFLSAKVQMIDPADPTQTGFGARSVSMELIVDTAAPPVYFGVPANVEDGLHPDSDSGVQDEPGAEITLDDRVTNDETPTFFGQAEANAYIRVYVDVNDDGVVDSGDWLVAETVAIPEDGTNQFPEGHWEATSYVNMNDQDLLAALEASGVIAADQIDRLRPMLVTAEDVAGNVSEPDQLYIFIDTQGPRITDVEINEEDHPYDLFDPKPSEDGPTPLVDSLVISVLDMPWRDDVDPNFLYEALWEDIAEEPGHYLVVGDANGVIPILDVIFDSDPVVNDQPATGTITLVFWLPGPDGVFHTSDDLGAPLPDDRFTLTISDSIVDPAGNALDGENNAIEPHEDPQFPSGDGNPGGDFVARFTVDSRPELGTWAAGSVYVDTNGNFIFDPDNLDYTNRDIVYTLAFTTCDVFAGNFADPFGEVPVADGFDKLAAYGHNTASRYRWLIDVDNDGVADINSVEPAWFDGLGMPVAGNFDGNALNGDEVGLFNGSVWMLDTNANYRVSDEVPIPGIQGYPIVGDFDGDGLDDLGTYVEGVFSFDLAGDGLGDGLDASFAFNYLDFIGVRERPVAHDFNQDGIDDIGLWVPDRAGVPLGEGAEWFILVSGGDEFAPDGQPDSVLDRIVPYPQDGGAVVEFTPIPFGPDMYAQFGDEYASPVVGNFDPPVASEASDPTVLSPKATDGDDTLVLVVDGPGQATATLNGIPLNVGAQVTAFEFDGLGGKDTVTITASSGDETIKLGSGVGRVKGEGYSIRLAGAESISVDGGGGTDVGMLFGLPGSKDIYRASPDLARMIGDGFRNEVVACRYAHGYGNTGDPDMAMLFDNPATTDTFESWPETKMARLFGPDFYTRAKSFRWTHGYSTPGNQDVAYLHDDPDQSEIFQGWPEMARLYGSDHYTRVKSFRWVHGYGTPGNKDVAYLRGNPDAADRFEAWPKAARLFGAGYYNRVKSFRYVHAYGTPGNLDRAYLYGSTANETVLANGRIAAMRRADYYNRAVDFAEVEAYGGGGTDSAQLYDAVLEAGQAQFPDASNILWLYQFDQITQHDTETEDETSTDAVDEIFTVYWM